MSIESVIPFNHLILCHTLLLLPSMFPSIKAISNDSVFLIRWPKYWSFTFSVRPSNKYSGLISFRIDWFDLLAIQGTLKSLLQNHSSKTSILQLSAFFTVQLSHPYMTTGKTIALAKRTFVGKLMSLILIWCLETTETVKEFIFLGSKITVNGDCSHEIKRHLLLGRKAMTNMKVKVKSLSRVRLFATPWTVAYPALSPGKSHGRRSLIIVSPSICHEMMGPDAVILVF